MIEFPVLVGDIGGTNARFAMLASPGAPPLVLPRMATSAHPSPAEAIAAALAGQRLAPRSMLLAVAAAVTGPVVSLTNARWICDAPALRRAFGLANVTLINDFVPVAASLEALRTMPGALAAIGPTVAATSGPTIVLGPGTGLGAAAVIPSGTVARILSTEAGHVSFGPSDAREEALFSRCERVQGRLTAETLVSGPGIARLYRALREEAGELPEIIDAGAVTERAARGDPHGISAIALAARLLGRFAGDLALLFGARGGVYVAGGVAPRIAPAIEAEFRRAFDDKAPLGAFMRAIPTFIVLDPDPALTGLRVLANAPEAYVYDRAVST